MKLPRRLSAATSKGGVGILLVLLGCLGVQIMGLGSNYWSSILVLGGIYAILAMGLNVVVGYTGMLTLGYAGFWAIGAYTTAFVTGRAPTPWIRVGFWEAIPFAVVATILVGLVLGVASLRVRGDYLAIVTLGFGEIVRIVANWWDPVTNGPTGITNIPHPSIFGFRFGLDPRPYVVLVWAFIGTVYFLVSRLWNSHIGRAWYAIRLDEDAADAVGVPTFRMKMLALAIGVSMAGLAGSIYACYVGYIAPDNFALTTSNMVMASLVLGGMSNAKGAIVGAFLVVSLPEVFRGVAAYRYLLFGAVLVLMMVVRPQGLLPIVARHYALPSETGDRKISRRPKKPVEDITSFSSRAILECREVSRHFGGLVAVDNVTFSVPPATVFAIIGPNGAGKTTLFNLITGALPLTTGHVEFAGFTMDALKPHQRTRLGVARTFQQIRLFGDVTVTENVLSGADCRISGNALQAALRTPSYRAEEATELTRVADVLEFCGIRHLADERASDLSYGDQRRVEIARALASEPDLLLLDEPAAGMNPTEKRQLMSLIADIKRQGITVILIEHDMGLVMEVSDQVMVLNHGAIIALGKPEVVQADPLVIEAYLGVDADAE